jgi:methylisocitrate lyase
MPTETAPAERLRQRIRLDDPLVVPGVTDGIAAALARAAGFSTVYVSGAGTAAARGFPDMSILSLTELVDAVRVVCSLVDAVVDLDTGYGSVLALSRGMRELEAAGASAVHIEDQPFPRRCGYLTAEPCVPVPTMLHRLDAARAAGTDLVIVGRTDALLTGGLDEAITRARAYSEAGAELVFVNGLRSLDELRAVRDSVTTPLLYNVSGSDRSPWLTREQAVEFGVAVIVHPIQAARAAARAVQRYLADLAADLQPEPENLIGFASYMNLAGWGNAEAFEKSLPDRTGDAEPSTESRGAGRQTAGSRPVSP